METSAKRPRSIFQFSLRGLLMFFAAAGLASGAMCQASEAWVGVIVSVTFVAILAAVIRAIFLTAGRRAFSIGFAICTASYFLLYFYIPLFYPAIPGAHELGEDRLIDMIPTTKLLNLLYGMTHSDANLSPAAWPETIESPVGGGRSGGAFQVGSNAVVRPTVQDVEVARSFLLIGQCIWAWVVGWLGGWFAQLLAWRQARRA
ncbi:MAG TPA: hypothetical protein VGY55_22265 [Pirellulales bacterium]|jgi:hypothetical protein|nr:hypothetical protein [Pirellulales bacterium]